MYMRVLKTALVEALRRTFSADYDVPLLRDLHVSLEYPIHEQEYPSIWVTYEDAAPLSIAGVAHVETDTEGRRYTRWAFQGYATLTIAALSSQELDTIYDEVVRVIAFSRENEYRSTFRNHVEANDLVAMNMDFDTIEPRGFAAAPGTPWGSDEIIYERGMALQIIGEFVSNPFDGDLVPLSKVIFEGYLENQEAPVFRGEYPPQ